MKAVFLAFFTLFISTRMAAQDTIFVYMDEQKAAQAIILPIETNISLELKKSLYKKAKSFVILVYGEHIGGNVYRRDLEISGDSTVIMTETTNRPGMFDISASDTRKKLAAGKILTLYLLLNPSNPNMMIPSKRIYLGNLVMK